MKNSNKLYIAYGSNLHIGQMKQRCPYAVPLGTTELRDYRLMFRGGNNAVATVEPKQGGSVPVLLWEITPRDEEALDRYEGWPRLYRKENVTVLFNGKPVEAMVYIMNEVYPYGLPGEYYLGVIKEGYASVGFDTGVLVKAVEASGMVKNCKLCKRKMVWENPDVPGHFHASSNDLEDWDICRECMVEHCCSTNCMGCEYGKYPDCRFLEMKRRYMKDD